jgi:hypothetical protein
MKLDVAPRGPLRDAGREARRLEGAGYEGIWAAETSHDPFLTMTLAAAAHRMNAYSPFEADDDLWAQVRLGFASQTTMIRVR